MGIKLSELKNKSRKLEVQYQEDTLHIEYFANVVTPSFQRELEQYKEMHESLVFQASTVIKTWDLFGEDGETPIPLTKETLDELPTEFLLAVVSAVVEDMQMDRNAKKS